MNRGLRDQRLISEINYIYEKNLAYECLLIMLFNCVKQLWYQNRIHGTWLTSFLLLLFYHLS